MGAMAGEASASPSTSTCKPSRQEIAETLQRLHGDTRTRQQEDAARREAQQERTRSLVRLMQLDTRDCAKVVLHAANATHYNERAAVAGQIRALETRYQKEKKALAAIHDKKERHESVQRAKVTRDKEVAALRKHLAQLEAAAPAVVRPGSSSSTGNLNRAVTPAGITSLPSIDAAIGRKSTGRPGATTKATFKELMEQIRAVKQGRYALLDPYMANLKEKELARVPPEMLDDVLEKQRLRSVANIHVRRGEFPAAQSLTARFVKLPAAKQLSLFATFAEMLSLTAPAEQSAMVFTGVFVVIWAGAAVVTINAQLLGSTISFFQSVCVLGYCVFPLNIATLVCMLVKVVVSHILLRAVIVAVGFLWSTRGVTPSSVVFMSKLVPPKRKALTVYPVLLFYLFISWMVLIQ
ncbi:hypothetical protein BBJ28_00023515 [Nothophytophthora sp. Chile5]|nr:hypothetical protein BBJ28_00023515 [Nothophytophthora sp. Chile5]